MHTLNWIPSERRNVLRWSFFCCLFSQGVWKWQSLQQVLILNLCGGRQRDSLTHLSSVKETLKDLWLSYTSPNSQLQKKKSHSTAAFPSFFSSLSSKCSYALVLTSYPEYWYQTLRGIYGFQRIFSSQFHWVLSKENVSSHKGSL